MRTTAFNLVRMSLKPVARAFSLVPGMLPRGDHGQFNAKSVGGAFKSSHLSLRLAAEKATYEMCRHLAVAMRGLSLEYKTNRFVLGGGVIKDTNISDEVLFHLEKLVPGLKISRSILLNNAQLIGAAAVAMESFPLALAKNEGVLAIDIGGSKISLALINSAGEIMDNHLEIKTPETGQEIIIALKNLIYTMYDKARERGFTVHAIGIDAPGIIEKGVVKEASFMLEKVQGQEILYPFILELKKVIGESTKITLVNDAEACGAGERMFGGISEKEFIALAIGTGLGGAYVNNAGKSTNIEPGERSYNLGTYGREDTISNFSGKVRLEEFVCGPALGRFFAKYIRLIPYNPFPKIV